MRWNIAGRVPQNSYQYFERTLITDNGFREYDVRWLLGKEINPNGFVVLGRAYGTYLQDILGERRVVVGNDFRSYSQDLSRSLVVGLMSAGMEVLDIGLALTPLVYFAQHHFQTKGGAMVTASHNENGWTGLKLANGLSSTLGRDGIAAFKDVVKGGKFRQGRGSYESHDDVFERYLQDLVAPGALPRRIKVVIAAGNGTAGRFAPPALERLGCEVIPVDCEPDWTFPRHNPNPEDLHFLHGISQATVEHKAQLGIGIDGDGDRIGVVDERGREIFSDKLGLLLARWLCPKYPGRSVVIDVKSTGLFLDDPVLRAAGAQVVMWLTGHSYIKAKVAETGALAGFEKSGHWFFSQPLGRGYDDALLSSAYVLRLLAETGRPLSELVDALPATFQSPTLGAHCADDVKYQVVEELTREFTDAARQGQRIAGSRITETITTNGIRYLLEDGGWGLVRASSNKPSLVLVAESRTSREQVVAIIADLKKRLAATGRVGDYDQQFP
jgi:phosphomannomutase/phosphoglucomutase